MTTEKLQTKRVHFIRHGESLCNKLRRELKVHLLPIEEQPVIVDAALTQEGKEQAKSLKEYIATLQPEIAVSSPFTRALQTCLLSYGSENVIVTPLCGETMSATCDVIGLPASSLKVLHPMFDFSSLEEIWWYIQDDIKSQPKAVNLLTQGKLSEESQDLIATRVGKFYEFLCKIPQQNIVVYSHCDFLLAFLSKYFGSNKTWLKNCEVHSVNFSQIPVPQ